MSLQIRQGTKILDGVIIIKIIPNNISVNLNDVAVINSTIFRKHRDFRPGPIRCVHQKLLGTPSTGRVIF